AQSVTLAPTSVAGGLVSDGTVTLEAPAGPGDLAVSLTSNNIMARVQDSQGNPITGLTIPAGQQTGTFRVQTSAVTARTIAKITATTNSSYKTASLRIKPIGVDAYSATPNPVTGTQDSIATIILTAPAGPGDVAVTLGTGNGSV